MLPRIIDPVPSYENIIGQCPYDDCGKENIFNRRDDLKTIRKITGLDVNCQFCNKPFRLLGDSLSLNFKELFWKAESFLPQKEYMTAVILLVQSIEMFFYFAIRKRLFIELIENNIIEDIDEINNLNKYIIHTFKSFTYTKLRNIFFDIYIFNRKFLSLKESRNFLNELTSSIKKDYTIPIITENLDKEKADIFIKIKDSKITQVRNSIIHKFAYRPSITEVQPLFEEGELIIYHLSNKLNLSYTNFLLLE